MVERPKIGDVYTNIAIIGRHVLKRESLIKYDKSGIDGKIQLNDALTKWMSIGGTVEAKHIMYQSVLLG